MKRRYEIPGFSQHLDKFCSEDRGNVLEKTGKEAADSSLDSRIRFFSHSSLCEESQIGLFSLR